MKKLILTSFLLSGIALANQISGVIEYQVKKAPKGVLFIFAKKFNSKRPMPIAVKKIESPKFPLKFSLDKSNAMIPDSPFRGPFEVTARLSPSGSALDKTGYEVKTTRPISVGTSDIKLIFK